MVLKLYGHNLSPPSKLVAMVLYEKEIPFEYISIDLLQGEQKSPDFLAKQPFGLVPVIDDDGFILYESRAIARYLEEKYPDHGTKLIPTDSRKRALFDQAVFTEIFHFDRYATPLSFEILYKKSLLGREIDSRTVEELTKNLTTTLDVYEQILSKQKYIAGDEPTLADLYHIPMGSRLSEARINLIQERPNVARWFNEISSRKSWRRAKDALVAV